jgi:hypothetical protein
MVAFPLFMYRVETNEFEHGLNFFQKAVLKFKAKPSIKAETIAGYIGLDPKLIAVVIAELQEKHLINEHGSLSEEGKETLNEIEGLFINSGKKKIGYVFKYVDEDKLYQYYVSKIIHADILNDSKSKYPQIVSGTKGDGEDYTESPFFMDEVYKLKSTFSRPTEREVLQLILNNNKKNVGLASDDSKDSKLTNQLGVRFIDEQAETIWVSTYIYLHQNEDDTYEPDWRVLDPFGFGDNVALKFYLNKLTNKKLLESIQKKFANVKTLGGRVLADFQEQMNILIEEKLISDFSIGLYRLDNNLQIYLAAIVRSIILLENQGYNDLDASVSLALNMQNALENILKLDRTNRESFYKKVYFHYDKDNLKKRDDLILIYRQRLFSSNTQVPHSLLSASKGQLERGSSLLSYLVSFILTYKYDDKSVLFLILRDRIELFIEVAQLRNEKDDQIRRISKREMFKRFANTGGPVSKRNKGVKAVFLIAADAELEA